MRSGATVNQPKLLFSPACLEPLGKRRHTTLEKRTRRQARNWTAFAAGCYQSPKATENFNIASGLIRGETGVGRAGGPQPRQSTDSVDDEAIACGARRDDRTCFPRPSAGRGILRLVQADAAAQGPQQPPDDPDADGGALRRRHPRQHGQPARRAADRARALQARAGHQGRRLHQVLRRPEADLRQVDDHHDGALWQKIRMPQQPAFHPDMFAEYIPYFLAAIRTKMEIWAEARPDRRDRRDGGADLDARRRHDLQGAVRPRHAVQPALRVQVREDLHRRDEPQVDPPQEGGRRGVRDHRGERGQGDGSLGRRAARGVRRRPARGSASARCSR